MTKKIITDEEAQEVKDIAGFEAGGYRSINNDVLKFYGCRTELDEDGDVEARYYPTTIEGKIAGYKVREHPKTFRAIGNTGNDCDLYGAFRFQNGGKYVLVVEGEEDTMAGFQMLKEYTDSKGSDFTIAVVGITVGAGNPTKQLANNYAFLNSFDNIILGFDADEAGTDAIEKAIAALPKGKVKIAKWTKAKDPNKYLEDGKQKQFIQDFYAAENYVPVGVLGSSHLYERMLQKSGQPKVPFPPLLEELNQMFVGGLSLGYIVNIASDTGTGKTTLVNELIYYWIFNSPHKVGILSMELDDAQYAEVLASRHLQKKLALMPDAIKADYIRTPEFKKKIETELFKNEDGSDRFFLVDDRDGSVEDLQDAIEQLIIGANCKVIVIDVLQDVLDGLSNEEQALFMKWSKSMIKSHGVLFIFINHKRKSASTGSGSGMNESDIHGSSTIIKSAGINILLGRDKMHVNEIIKNTTVVEVPKNRLTGITGQAGALWYNNEEHTLYNFYNHYGITFAEYKEQHDPD